MPQLRWQCRRGMRELDELLLRYLENVYAEADAAEKQAFHSLLDLSDPELASYLLQQREPPAELLNVITQIRRRAAP
jgi:antitoxin CptB